jgi:hypothetical protein
VVHCLGGSARGTGSVWHLYMLVDRVKGEIRWDMFWLNVDNTCERRKSSIPEKIVVYGSSRTVPSSVAPEQSNAKQSCIQLQYE